MSNPNPHLPAWLCLVSPFETIRVRPFWSAQLKRSVIEHYRSAGLYRDVFLVHADTRRRATRKARTRARQRNTFSSF